MRPLLLRIHRYVALAFAAPLLIVVGTGLVISFEPILAAMPVPGGRLTMEAFEPALRRADPDGRATTLFMDAHGGSFSVGGRGGARLAIATGEKLPDQDEGPGLMRTARGLHQTLLLDDTGEMIVIGSTVAMIALLLIGLLMGLPRRLRSTVPGWHKAMGWFLSPLLVLSPATGLALAFGWFAPPRGDRVAPPPTLVEAVRIVAAQHDLNEVVWIRRRGANLIARVRDGGEWRGFIVGQNGLTPQPRNWPRLLHEGNWSGVVSGGLNVIVSLALLGLLGTGLVIWWRKDRLKKQARGGRGCGRRLTTERSRIRTVPASNSPGAAHDAIATPAMTAPSSARISAWKTPCLSIVMKCARMFDRADERARQRYRGVTEPPLSSVDRAILKEQRS